MNAKHAFDGRRFDAVFFDLDGTLVDTAPDMVAVLLRLLEKHDRPAVDPELARSHVSNGAIGLLKIGFPDAEESALQQLHTEYLDDYAASICRSSVIFEPLNALLTSILGGNRKWGVVTNKPERMTLPLLSQLGIGQHAACIVCGDTLPLRKPHPAPMLHAAQQAGVQPHRTIYVGDASRDIEAGRAAQMATVAVGYGYITDGDDPQSWGADAFAADTMELTALIEDAMGL